MEQKVKTKMVPAIIEQIMMWMIIFVSFVTLLFLVIDYSLVMRIKGNMDLLSEYGARMVSLGNKTDDEIATRLNTMKNDYFADISGNNIACTTDENAGTYQVIFNLNGSYVDTNILEPQNNMTSKRVVFNESSSGEIVCNLTLVKE